METIRQGTIYRLGRHILACGSATDADFIAKVLGNLEGGGVRAIITDPPYGVDYVGGKKDFAKLGAEGGARDIINDHIQTEESYLLFTKDWLEAVKPYLESYNACYIFNSDMMFRALRNGMEAAGFYYSQMLIWIKNTVVVGRKDYLPQHEIIAYGWFGRHKMERSKAKSIQFYPKPARSKIHPTMKPVGLLRNLLPNSTKTGEWVYDPFGGSGSTLIACEQLRRRCVMVELDPEYCRRIIKRWEKLTQKKAELYD